MVRALIHLALACAAAAVASASSLLTLNSANVDSALLKATKPVLVAFTQKWCGHCVQAKPKLYAASADPFVQSRSAIATVDCGEDDSKHLCEAFNVQGYPHIVLIPPKTGSIPEAKKQAIRFVGPRSTAGFRDFMLRMTRPEPLVFLRPATHPGAYSPESFEGEYATTTSPNFSLDRLIGGLGRDGVSFLLVVPTASSGGSGEDELLAQKSSIDYSSSKAAKQSGAHPFITATIAAAESLKSEVTVLAATADVIKSNAALKEALKPLLEASIASVSSLKEPILLQIQTSEKRVEVARVACEGGSKSEQTSSNSNPLLGVDTIAYVPCDPATGTPLSSSSKSDELADTVKKFISSMRFPSVTELTPDTYPYLANNQGTYLAIAVVNETEIKNYEKTAKSGVAAAKPGKPVLMPPKSALFMTSIQKLASRSSTSLPQATRNKFLFGWLDSEIQ
jgi:thiol-disulfide isomerase/thioredoxin